MVFQQCNFILRKEECSKPLIFIAPWLVMNNLLHPAGSLCIIFCLLFFCVSPGPCPLVPIYIIYLIFMLQQ